MIKRRLKVEIADNSFKHERGLMFRKKLGEDEGMLFSFDSPKKLKFWGVNTFIPLSIAFVSPENKIVKIDYISPLSDKTVNSEKECNMAIEANYDFFSRNKVQVGDKIKIISEGINSFILFPN